MFGTEHTPIVTGKLRAKLYPSRRGDKKEFASSVAWNKIILFTNPPKGITMLTEQEIKDWFESVDDAPEDIREEYNEHLDLESVLKPKGLE